MIVTHAKLNAYFLDAAGFTSTQAVRNACQLNYCYGFSFYNGGWYGVTREQLQIAVDHGKPFSPNWERRSNEALFNTPFGGNGAVDSFVAQNDKWGVDSSAVHTILSGVDYWAPSADWPQLDYWHEAACDRADERDALIGYYGFTAYGNHLINRPFWNRKNRPTWTWGGSGVIIDTAAKQHYGYPSGLDWSSIGVTVDESEVLGELSMVYSFDSAPQEEDMGKRWFVQNKEDYPSFNDPDLTLHTGPGPSGSFPPGWVTWEIMQGGKRHILGPEWGALTSSSRKLEEFSDITAETTGWLQNMPDYVESSSGGSTDLAPVMTELSSIHTDVNKPRVLN